MQATSPRTLSQSAALSNHCEPLQLPLLTEHTESCVVRVSALKFGSHLLVAFHFELLTPICLVGLFNVARLGG